MGATHTDTETQEVIMSVNITTIVNDVRKFERGLVPIGSILTGCADPMWDGKIVVDWSPTAYYLVETLWEAISYLVDDVPCGGWVSFDAVHGKPGFVAPLVEFGG